MNTARPPEAVTEPSVAAELRDLVKRAKAGDRAALPRIREIMDAHPGVWEYLGDVENVVTRALAELLANEDPVLLEAIRRKAEVLRTELQGDNPSTLEKLLVGQVVSSWLELAHCQMLAANTAGLTPSQGSFRLRRAESSQKRHQAAVKLLATVRHLLPRGLQPVPRLGLFDPAKRKKA